MSGVILLIGALAIGGRGLNLGIDFTSGTRITVGLEHAGDPATGDASEVTVCGDFEPHGSEADGRYKSSGPTRTRSRSRRCLAVDGQKIENALQSKFGIADSGKTFNYDVGRVRPSGRRSPTARWSRSSPRCW